MEVITKLHFKNKQELYELCNVYFKHINDSIKITTHIKESIGYFGWKYYYENSETMDVIKIFLDNITMRSNKKWVKKVIWNIYNALEATIDSIPIRLLKLFTNDELEKYIFDVINNILINNETGGYIEFIIEKTIFVDDIEYKELLKKYDKEISNIKNASTFIIGKTEEITGNISDTSEEEIYISEEHSTF